MVKIGYSQVSLLLFIGAIALKLMSVFAISSPLLSPAFLIVMLIGLVLIGIETVKQKHFAPAFNFDNRFKLSFFAFMACFGFFADFLSDSLKLYDVVMSKKYGVFISALLSGAEATFAIISAVCMIMVSLSFKKNTRYDFRELRLLNICPLLWIIIKGVAMLQDVWQALTVTELSKYMAVISCIVAFYSFAKEVDNHGGAYTMSVLSFRIFAYTAVLYFICQLSDVISGQFTFYEPNSVFALSMFLIGIFAYFLEKNILAYTKIE